MSFWADKRVCVTGGAGFLGSSIVEKLKSLGAKEIFVPRKREYDLVHLDAIQRMLADARPDLIIHLAARVGGIGANRARPAEFFYDNLMMSIPLFHEARRSGVEKFVAIGTVCAYPKYTEATLSPGGLWRGDHARFCQKCPVVKFRE